MSAQKDRLIEAADLLGMTPDALHELLLSANGIGHYAGPFADGLLVMARERQEAILSGNRVDPEDARTLARAFRELDIYLSAGGTPPEAWREGPDAPADSGPWGWQGDPVADDPDNPLVNPVPRPAPEGLAVFAHWSATHDGINVEMDVPDGLRVTVHYNDALMVDHQVSEDGRVAFDRMSKLDADRSHNDIVVIAVRGADR